MLVRQLPTPDPRLRWLTVIGLALFSACGTWLFRSLPQPYPSDFWPIWQGARLFLHGQNPYPIIGTDAAPFPTALMYPLPALLTAIPLAWLPIRVVDPLVVGLAGGIFAWWLTRDGWSPGLLLFFSMPWRYLMQVSQGWDAASLLAVSVPWVGFLLVGKPTIGAAVWFMRPRVSSALMAVAMVAVSLLIWPTWIPAWRAAVATAGHFQAPILLPGGWILGLSIANWRDPRARLLFALSCVPQTTVLCSVVLLFLIPRTWLEGGILFGLSSFAAWEIDQRSTYAILDTFTAWAGPWLLVGCYFPCLAMVLGRRRPDEGDFTSRLGDERWFTSPLPTGSLAAPVRSAVAPVPTRDDPGESPARLRSAPDISHTAIGAPSRPPRRGASPD